MRLVVAASLSVLALATSACNACDRSSLNGAHGSASTGVSTSALENGKKPFGASCVGDHECADDVCFHQRAHRGGDAGRERADGGDAEEHDGYCSMRCATDRDCPTSASRGKCGARGMCKR